MLAVEFNFTQRQLMEDFSLSFLEDMVDYKNRKIKEQNNGGH